MLTRIAQIPCEVRATRIFVQKPLGPQCESDLDCNGYSEIEFDVFDLRGYRAGWLYKKMTAADIDRIERSLLAQNRP